MIYAGNLLAYRGANLGAIAGKRLALEQKRSNAEDARRAAMVEGAAPSGAESVDEHTLDGDDVVSSAFRQDTRKHQLPMLICGQRHSKSKKDKQWNLSGF